MNILRNRNEVIAYTIDKNINPNLYISVQNGEVVVKAPWYLSRNQIQEIVEEKKRWIMEKLKEYEIAKEGYIQGDTVMLLGQNYRIKMRYRNIKAPQLDLQENDIKITIPNKYKKIEKEDILKVLIEKMYQTVAKREVEEVMEKTRILLGFAPEDYVIKKMKQVLGTCDENKVITINPDIVKYRPEIIEYIVLHEFFHLKYKNHTKRFYQEIQNYIPDYEKYKLELINMKY